MLPHPVDSEVWAELSYANDIQLYLLIDGQPHSVPDNVAKTLETVAH